MGRPSADTCVRTVDLTREEHRLARAVCQGLRGTRLLGSPRWADDHFMPEAWGAERSGDLPTLAHRGVRTWLWFLAREGLGQNFLGAASPLLPLGLGFWPTTSPPRRLPHVPPAARVWAAAEPSVLPGLAPRGQGRYSVGSGGPVLAWRGVSHCPACAGRLRPSCRTRCWRAEEGRTERKAGGGAGCGGGRLPCWTGAAAS